MKIIKQGIPERVRIWKGTCSCCKAEMSEIQANLKIIYDQRDGPFARAKCPVCEKNFYMYPFLE